MGQTVHPIGKYYATPPSLSNGELKHFRLNSEGDNCIAEQFAPSYEDNTVGVAKAEYRGAGTYISTATTTTVKTGAGHLHTITITEAVASTIIVYDNTAGSGTILASFVASAAVNTYTLDITFSVGLTIVTAGASKLTVSYR